MFCVRGFGGGLGFLSFLGVVLACPSCFLGLLGFSVFLVVLLLLVGVGGGLRGVPGFGVGAPGWFVLLLFVGGRVWGASACARFLSCPVLAVVGVGGRVRGARVARLPAVWWGSGCARFPVRVRGVVVVFAGGFRVLFFPSGASCVFWFCGCLVLCWVVVSAGSGGCGGCRVGFGVVFFSGFCCTGPGLFPVSFCGGWFGFGLGFVWRV